MAACKGKKAKQNKIPKGNRISQKKTPSEGKYLTDNGVGSDVLYPVPPHRQPCYINEFGSLSLPKTDAIANSVVSIPVSSMTSPADSRQISDIINGFK